MGLVKFMSEYAHSGTGVDINAGSTIGEYFFIDHATGVVIGETTVVGDHVKIYQGFCPARVESAPSVTPW